MNSSGTRSPRARRRLQNGGRGLRTAYALGRAVQMNEAVRRAAETPEYALLRGEAVVPVPFEQERWWVRSDRKLDDVYLIEREGAEWACTCDGHLLGGHQCKHIRQVQEWLKAKA